MRPLEPKVLPAEVETGPVVLMLYAAYGGLCGICESPITARNVAIDIRTGQRAPDRYDPARWPSLLLLCGSCHDAHELRLSSYDPQALLLPFDRYPAGVEPDAAFTYDLRAMTLEQVDEAGAIASARVQAVIVSAHADRAQRTIDHFALNGPFFVNDRTLRMPDSDPRVTTDGRLRMRLNAWQLAEKVSARFAATGDARPIADRIEQARGTLALAGCWSSEMAAIWQSQASAPLLRQLFGNTHPGTFQTRHTGVLSLHLAGPTHGNEWAGTRRTFFDDLDAALAVRR